MKFRLFRSISFPGDGDFALPDFELTAQAHAVFEVFFVEVFFFFFGEFVEVFPAFQHRQSAQKGKEKGSGLFLATKGKFLMGGF